MRLAAETLLEELREILRHKWMVAFFIFCLLCMIGGCSSCFLEHDNPIEEMAEQIIFDKYGIPLDLSPLTPEQTSTNIEPIWKEDKARLPVSMGLDF